jgi:hypothetical protein
VNAGDELEQYEAESELKLYREYRDVFGMFSTIVETDQRFFLCNEVAVETRAAPNGQVYFEVVVGDAWIWDTHRPARLVRSARITTFKDVHIEELPPGAKPDFGALDRS